MRAISRAFVVLSTVLVTLAAGSMLSAASATYRTTANPAWVPN